MVEETYQEVKLIFIEKKNKLVIDFDCLIVGQCGESFMIGFKRRLLEDFGIELEDISRQGGER